MDKVIHIMWIIMFIILPYTWECGYKCVYVDKSIKWKILIFQVFLENSHFLFTGNILFYPHYPQVINIMCISQFPVIHVDIYVYNWNKIFFYISNRDLCWNFK